MTLSEGLRNPVPAWSYLPSTLTRQSNYTFSSLELLLLPHIQAQSTSPGKYFLTRLTTLIGFYGPMSLSLESLVILCLFMWLVN